MNDQAEHTRASAPCCPGGSGACKLAGVYTQRGGADLMQRIRIPGGRLEPRQWRGLANLVEGHGIHDGLHLTTRQDIEIHGIRPESLAGVQAELTALELSYAGACGDTLRNITVCPGSGLCCGSRDLLPVARAVQDVLSSHPEIYNLPRKFKISFSGCRRSCAMPWISDLGFVADGQGALSVIGAGSLGANPATGIELYTGLSPRECVLLARAAIELFLAEGDRQNRSRARLRHVRQRLGDERFRKRLDGLFARQRLLPDVAAVHPEPPADRQWSSVRLQFPAGDVTPAQARALAQATEAVSGFSRIDMEHGVRLYGAQRNDLPIELATLCDQPTVVSCPGTEYCARAVAPARLCAALIRQALPRELGCSLGIRVSGCANGCVHSAVADIGLVPRGPRSADDTECYQIMVGGQGGRGSALAKAIGKPVPRALVAEMVAALAAEFARSGNWRRAESALREATGALQQGRQ